MFSSGTYGCCQCVVPFDAYHGGGVGVGVGWMLLHRSCHLRAYRPIGDTHVYTHARQLPSFVSVFGRQTWHLEGSAPASAAKTFLLLSVFPFLSLSLVASFLLYSFFVSFVFF